MPPINKAVQTPETLRAIASKLADMSDFLIATADHMEAVGAKEILVKYQGYLEKFEVGIMKYRGAVLEARHDLDASLGASGRKKIKEPVSDVHDSPKRKRKNKHL